MRMQPQQGRQRRAFQQLLPVADTDGSPVVTAHQGAPAGVQAVPLPVRVGEQVGGQHVDLAKIFEFLRKDSAFIILVQVVHDMHKLGVAKHRAKRSFCICCCQPGGPVVGDDAARKRAQVTTDLQGTLGHERQEARHETGLEVGVNGGEVFCVVEKEMANSVNFCFKNPNCHPLNPNVHLDVE